MAIKESAFVKIFIIAINLCCLEFEHNGDHFCSNKEHKCKMECSLKNLSKGCINGGICSMNLPHSIKS